ncbi:MAG: hypothetical protein ABJA86_09255 [Nocardioidaceae bacterium]
MTVLLMLAVAALVAIRLVPSLVGVRAFLGLDLLSNYAPWSSFPGAHRAMTSIYVSDQIDGWIPALREIHDRFWSGDISSWSNLVGGGAPLLANPDYALLSPGRWLFLVLPLWLAPGWSKLLELAFAATFTYLLVRRLNGSKLAAALAGFVYPLTGFMIGWTNWPHVAVGSAIPMLLWALERFVQVSSIRAAIPISLASALLVFGGFPAVAGQTFYVGAGYLLVRVLTNRSALRDRVRQLVLAGAAVAVGVGLTAVQLLPFTHQILADADLSYRESGFFSHTPFRYLMTTVFPQTFAENGLPVNFGSPMDLNSYVGAVVLLFAVLGVVHAIAGRVGGSAGVYLVAVALGVVVLIWWQGPWTDWMNNLPVFHGNPIGRVRSQLGIPAAVLAAAGFDAVRGISWSRGWTSWRGLRSWWLPLVTAAGVCAAVWAVGIKIANGPFVGLAASKWPDVLLAGVPLLLITALLAVGWRLRAARVAALAVAIASIGAQAVGATAFYWPTAPTAEFYPSTAGIRYLQEHVRGDRMATLGYTMRPNVTSYYDLRTINGHSFYPRPMKALMQAIYPGSFVGATYSILSTQPDRWLNSAGLDRLGVRYLVADAAAPLPGTHNTPVPIPGDADPLPAAAGTMSLQVSTNYQASFAGGSLRGISVPLTLATPTTVTAELTDSHGATLARNSVKVGAGSWNVPVPLAAEPAGATAAADPQQSYTVTVSVDRQGVVASGSGGNRLRLQAVRSPKASDSARLAYASDGLVVWERLRYLPRIRWASHATVIRDPAARLKAVATAPSRANEVILAGDPPAGFDSADALPTSFEIRHDSGDSIKIHLQTSSPGFVVVSDNIQNDFVATVDGHQARITDADYAVGAVYVDAGSHDVELNYDPRGRRTGVIVSTVSAVILVFVGVFGGKRWRRLRSPKSAPEAPESA